MLATTLGANASVLDSLSYDARLGYTVGGTIPTHIGKEIRGINSFNPGLNFAQQTLAATQEQNQGQERRGPQSHFSTCLSLTTVNFHNLVSIGKDAFEDCTALSSFNMGNRLESIGVSSFINCKALTGEISLPATVTNIGASAFVNCTGLQSIFVNRTEATTFGRDFYPSSVEGFACYVPLNQFYDFYSKMKTNTY